MSIFLIFSDAIGQTTSMVFVKTVYFKGDFFGTVWSGFDANQAALPRFGKEQGRCEYGASHK